MGRMKVRDVMTGTVVTVREDAPIKEVVEVLMAYDVSGVPVVDDAGAVVGMVTEGDLLGKEAGVGPRRRRLLEFVADVVKGRQGSWHRKITGTTAGELMSTPALTAFADEDVRYPARRMMRSGVKRLPVLEDGKLVGIISRHDILNVFDRPDPELRAEVEKVLQRALFVPPYHDVHVEVEDGVVSLSGLTHYETDTRIAEVIVRGVDGVIAVKNELTFKLPDPHYVPM